MTSEIKSYGELASELSQAKNSLKDYDDNIKRLIGRDPSDSNQRNVKRGAPNQNDEFRNRFQDNSFSRQRNHNRNQNYGNQNNFNTDEPPLKKRSMDSSVFKRLDKRPSDLEDLSPTKMQMPSRVIVTPREVPSRQDALKAQDRDEKSKARNRRMFGALLGTLQKFRQEETKLKPKEQKRAQVEKKLEEQEVMEQEKVKKERYELFLGRKKKQQEIRILEQKMTRIAEHALWESKQKPLANFIKTKTEPCIYYLPRKLTPSAKEKLEASRKLIEKSLEEKKHELEQELESFELKFKKEEEHKDLEDGEIEDSHDDTQELNEDLDQTVTSIELDISREEIIVKPEKVKIEKLKEDKPNELKAEIQSEVKNVREDEPPEVPENNSPKEENSPKEDKNVMFVDAQNIISYPVNISLDDIIMPPEPEVKKPSAVEGDKVLEAMNPQNPESI